jgi:hypothetical protein
VYQTIFHFLELHPPTLDAQHPSAFCAGGVRVQFLALISPLELVLYSLDPAVYLRHQLTELVDLAR